MILDREKQKAKYSLLERLKQKGIPSSAPNPGLEPLPTEEEEEMSPPDSLQQKLKKKKSVEPEDEVTYGSMLIG